MRELYAIVDIETTGSGNGGDRITEIAIVLHDGKKIIDSFETLLNPGRNIPTFITRLTGISNAMVVNAPTFEEVSDKAWGMTENAIFIAHNVGFDYGFIQKEFASLGIQFKRKRLCTVRLSRKVFPGFKSYSLGDLIARFGIVVNDRHRAMADTMATVELFEHILQNDSDNHILLQLNNGLLEKELPQAITMDELHELPERTGVYYFHGINGEVLYVGKGLNIQKKVMKQLSQSSKRMLGLKKEINDISTELTGSELVMLIKETLEIDKHQPKFNIAKRKNNFGFCIHHYTNEAGIVCLAVSKFNGKLNIIAGFEYQIEAIEILKKNAREFKLCNLYLNLEEEGPYLMACHHPQCGNVCFSNKNPEYYNSQVALAIESIRISFKEEFAIIGKGRTIKEKSVVLIQEGEFKGFGYFDPENIRHFDDVLLQVKSYPNLANFEYFIKKALRHGKLEKVIPLTAENITR